MRVYWHPTETEHVHRTCPYHERRGGSHAGCTCFSAWISKAKPVEDWTKQERERYFAQYRLPDPTPQDGREE